jgi:hypothetical protein
MALRKIQNPHPELARGARLSKDAVRVTRRTDDKFTGSFAGMTMKKQLQ